MHAACDICVIQQACEYSRTQKSAEDWLLTCDCSKKMN